MNEFVSNSLLLVFATTLCIFGLLFFRTVRESYDFHKYVLEHAKRMRRKYAVTIDGAEGDFSSSSWLSLVQGWREFIAFVIDPVWLHLLCELRRLKLAMFLCGTLTSFAIKALSFYSIAVSGSIFDILSHAMTATDSSVERVWEAVLPLFLRSTQLLLGTSLLKGIEGAFFLSARGTVFEDLKLGYFRALLGRDAAFHGALSPHLSRWMKMDIVELENMLLSFPRDAGEAVGSLFFSAYMLATLDPSTTLCLLLLHLPNRLGLESALNDITRAYQLVGDELTVRGDDSASQSLEHATGVKLFVAEGAEVARAGAFFAASARVRAQRGVGEAFLTFLRQLLRTGESLAQEMLCFASVARGTMTPGGYVVFSRYNVTFQESLLKTWDLWSNVKGARATLKRYFHLRNGGERERASLASRHGREGASLPSAPASTSASTASGKKDALVLDPISGKWRGQRVSGSIEFRNVSFHYPARSTEGLEEGVSAVSSLLQKASGGGASSADSGKSASSSSLSSSSSSSSSTSSSSSNIDAASHCPSKGPSQREPKKVLNGLSFNLEAGQKVALVGPTGSGKTTVFRLLCGLYDSYEGEIFIDRVNLREYDLQSLRRRLACVEQISPLRGRNSVSLFLDRSVRENLLFGMMPDGSAESLPRQAHRDAYGEIQPPPPPPPPLPPSQEAMEAACEKASIHSTIASWPQGYDTILGDEASPGELQRLLLARVLLRDPAILLLDECFSSVDATSAAAIMAALEAARGERTCLQIAHNFSSINIATADKIVVLEGGKAVEVGTHRELKEQAGGGVYERLLAQQVKGLS